LRKKKAVIVAVVATVVGTLVFANLVPHQEQIEQRIDTEYGVSDDSFRRTISNLLGPPLLPGNRVEELVNGEQMFPAMLAAIRSAQKNITFETYIYWAGSVASEFAAALCERARAGVKVHLLLDWAGTKADPGELEKMREAGVEVKLYNPLHWFHITRMNNRTHRKILVIDGCVGFTGGAGLGDEWLGNGDSPEHWRDTQFRLEGLAVAQMQAAFNEHWIQVSGRVLHGPEYFPQLQSAGRAWAQVVNSSSPKGAQTVRLLYLLSIAAARESILISNPYLIPDRVSMETLVAAAKRGVRIAIILPGKITDAQMVRKASKACWGPLLEAGVEIYEFQPTLYHCKVMVVDGLWCSVGSTNFDDRSFRLNDETNLNVYDSEFARRQLEIFESDLKSARRVTLEEWRARPSTEKLVEHLAGLFRSQL
jgi:cardiolipin synthase A/B